MSEALQKRMSKELEQYKETQKEVQKAQAARQQLDAQLNENTLVKEELDTLNSESNVFKMIGPVLVKQDLEEAKQTVKKRMEYINTELKRQEELIADYDQKSEKYRESLTKLQQQFQQQQVKAAARS